MRVNGKVNGFWVLVVSPLVFALAGCSGPTSEENVHDPIIIPPFTLIERGGQTVTDADLRGKVWVASFIFTRCAGPCPQVSGTMARIQKELDREKDVRLVTITVDPEFDRPEVLKEYAGRYGADPERWLFLTGKPEAIYPLLNGGFKLAAAPSEGKARTPGNEVTHSTRLVLVDRKGHVRGYFEGRQIDEQGNPVDDLPKLRRALAQVLREPS
jgi:cytochrome oxidase Cu insertion factor (SCO1/SenC/PrrC family)